MSRFLTPLRCEKIGARLWKLTDPLIFEWTVNEIVKVTFTAPKDFVTDFASIPRLFFLSLPPVGDYDEEAVLHDYLYFIGWSGKRSECDKLFKIALEADDKIAKFTRFRLYTAVRLGGWVAWRKHRKNDATRQVAA